jgi:hypothetical protein
MRGTDRLSNLPMVTYLISGRAEVLAIWPGLLMTVLAELLGRHRK